MMNTFITALIVSLARRLRASGGPVTMRQKCGGRPSRASARPSRYAKNMAIAG